MTNRGKTKILVATKKGSILQGDLTRIGLIIVLEEVHWDTLIVEGHHHHHHHHGRISIRRPMVHWTAVK